MAWLPDAWGQGIKVTKPISRSTGGKGGTLTMFVSPDGKTAYFHKPKVEKYEGRKLTRKEGFNGQVRLAKLQAEQTIELARAEMKQMCAGGNGASGADPDEEFFKLLSKAERKQLVSILIPDFASSWFRTVLTHAYYEVFRMILTSVSPVQFSI